MTGMELLTLGGLFLAIFVTEFFVLYASTALGNVDLNLGKWLLASVLITVVWAALSYGGYLTILAYADRKEGLFTLENRSLLLAVSGSALFASWLISALAFIPVFPTSVLRGMLVSMFQVLLRLFLYVLIGAVVMVVLAVLQILYKPSGEKSGPATAAPLVSKVA